MNYCYVLTLFYHKKGKETPAVSKKRTCTLKKEWKYLISFIEYFFPNRIYKKLNIPNFLIIPNVLRGYLVWLELNSERRWLTYRHFRL